MNRFFLGITVVASVGLHAPARAMTSADLDGRACPHQPYLEETRYEELRTKYETDLPRSQPGKVVTPFPAASGFGTQGVTYVNGYWGGRNLVQDDGKIV